MRRFASWRRIIKYHVFESGRCRKRRCKRLRAAVVLVFKLLSSSLQYFVSVCVDTKQEGGRFFILGFSMLSFQICFPVNMIEARHVKVNFYRQSFFVLRRLVWHYWLLVYCKRAL